MLRYFAPPCNVTSMEDKEPRAVNARLEPDVRQQLIPFCRAERRTMNNAVNLLIVEALTARGLWQAGQAQGSTED